MNNYNDLPGFNYSQMTEYSVLLNTFYNSLEWLRTITVANNAISDHICEGLSDRFKNAASYFNCIFLSMVYRIRITYNSEKTYQLIA